MTKLIHFVWLGPNPISDRDQEFIEGWREHYPDFEVKIWRDDDAKEFPTYMKRKGECYCWAQHSDILRVLIVEKYGGVYADTDIQSVRTFEDLMLEHDFIAGMEHPSQKVCCNGFFYSAEPGHPILSNMAEAFKTINLKGQVNVTTGPLFFSNNLYKYKTDKTGIFPREYFHPRGYWETDVNLKLRVTSNTRTIHFWNKSW